MSNFIEHLHKETFCYVKWSGATEDVYKRLRDVSIDYLKEMNNLLYSDREAFMKKKEVRDDINYMGGILNPEEWYF